jgi:hypothetical protein
MGSKFASVSISGFDASPPADDGSQTASNLVSWATEKSKLATPLKTAIESINTGLVTAFDYSVRQITSSDNSVATDHMKCVEIAPTVTTAVVVSLGDAATMTNNYRVFVKNSSGRNQTLALVTAADTLDGTANGTLTLPPNSGVMVQTNATPNGYLVVSTYGKNPIVLTGAAGTNTVTAVTAPSLNGYAAGQLFVLVPAATNTAATTLNVSGLGAKSIYWNGAACSGGELVISVPTLLEYDGTQFNIIGPMIGSRITNSLSGDVSLNNTGTYFDGPTVAQGTVGTWFASGTITLIDTGGPANISVKLWDGTTVIASAFVQVSNNQQATLSLSGYLASPAGNIRISAKDASLTTGKILFNASGNSKDSTISAIRIA